MPFLRSDLHMEKEVRFKSRKTQIDSISGARQSVLKTMPFTSRLVVLGGLGLIPCLSSRCESNRLLVITFILPTSLEL